MLEMLKEFYKEKCETPGVAVPFGGQSPIFPKVEVEREPAGHWVYFAKEFFAF